MRSMRICVLVFFAAFGVAGAALGQFGVTVSVNMEAQAISETLTVTDEDHDPPNPHHDTIIVSSNGSANAEIPRITTFVDGHALAAFGDLSLRASAAVFGTRDAPNADFGVGFSNVTATIGDNYFLNAESIPFGNSLLIRAKLTIDGGINVNVTTTPAHPSPFNPGLILPETSGSVLGGLGIIASQGSFIDGDPNLPNTRTLANICKNACVSGDVSNLVPPDSITWTFVAKNGELTAMNYSATLFVKAISTSANNAAIDGRFSGSIHWGGIESVEDAITGEVIDDWTITSQSGFDYSKSFENQVPEPSSLVLLASTLCARLALGRRRQTTMGSK